MELFHAKQGQPPSPPPITSSSSSSQLFEQQQQKQQQQQQQHCCHQTSLFRIVWRCGYHWITNILTDLGLSYICSDENPYNQACFDHAIQLVVVG